VSAEPSLVRIAGQWLLAVVVALSATAFFFSLAAVQVTSEDTGQRIHRRAAAELTDIDAVLPSIETSLSEAATTGDSDTILVPGFPIPVELTREEASSLRGDDLKQRLLRDSGTLLYRDGMSVWANGDPQGEQEIDNVSSAAAVYRSLDLIRDSTHDYLVVLAVLPGILTVILAGVLLWSIRSGFMRLLAVGVALLVASMPALAAAVAVRFALKTAQADGDTFVEGMLELGAEVMWLPIRLYLALSMVGFATIGIASVGMWLESRTPGQTVTPTNQSGS
jgi:hypothetical protein